MTRITTMLAVLLLGFALTLPTVFAGGEPPREGEGEPICRGALDVLFVFDTTGSMGSVLTDAKSGASSVMSNVQSTLPGSAFGVADYRDSPGYFAYPGYATTFGGSSDWAWKLLQPVDTDATLSNAAISTLTPGGGADGPEALSRAAYESYADTGVNWRAGSTRVVVVFTDAPAHDSSFAGNNFGNDPGRDGVALTADDLDFETVVADAATNGIRFATVGVGGNWGAPYLQYMADETDGVYAASSGNFVDQVTDMILEAAGYTMTAHADAVLADISSLTAAYLDIAHVEAGPHADSHDETFLTVTLPNALNGYAKTAEGHAHTAPSASMVDARAWMNIERVSVLGGLVQAELLRADAHAVLTSGGATGSAAGSHVAKVIVAGIPVSTSPNTMVLLPQNLGYVVINEQIIDQSAPDSVSVEVNMIHIVLNAPGLDADIKISHAFVGVSCSGGFKHHDGPTPPQDPTLPDPTAPGVPPTTPDCPDAFPAAVCKAADSLCRTICLEDVIELPTQS